MPKVHRFAIVTRSTVIPGARHVDEEHRKPAAPGGVGIGAGDRAAPVGLVGAGDEHLLAVEHEAVAVGARAVVTMFDRSEPAPASVYAMHAFTVPATAAGRNGLALYAVLPNASTVGATSTAAVSISGASWYAAS